MGVSLLDLRLVGESLVFQYRCLLLQQDALVIEAQSPVIIHIKPQARSNFGRQGERIG